MNIAPSVTDVDLVQVDMEALILSCVDPVTKLARMYSCLSSQVESEDLAQIGMLRVCEMAPQLYPVADTQERLIRSAGRAMLDEIQFLSQHPTVSWEAYLASAPSDSFVTDLSGTLLSLVESSDIEGPALFGTCATSVQSCDLPIIVLDTDAEYVALGCEQEPEVWE